MNYFDFFDVYDQNRTFSTQNALLRLFRHFWRKLVFFEFFDLFVKKWTFFYFFDQPWTFSTFMAKTELSLPKMTFLDFFDIFDQKWTYFRIFQIFWQKWGLSSFWAQMNFFDFSAFLTNNEYFSILWHY